MKVAVTTLPLMFFLTSVPYSTGRVSPLTFFVDVPRTTSYPSALDAFVYVTVTVEPLTLTLVITGWDGVIALTTNGYAFDQSLNTFLPFSSRFQAWQYA